MKKPRLKVKLFLMFPGLNISVYMNAKSFNCLADAWKFFTGGESLYVVISHMRSAGPGQHNSCLIEIK